MEIALKALLIYVGAVVAMAAMLFVPAGTLDYWQAWIYLEILFALVAFVMVYFLAKDPQFLERRLKMKEREKEQKLVQKVGGAIALAGFLLPGLDRRFGWSNVPTDIVLAADVFVLLGYALIFLVFRENHYAGRTVEVVKGQKVIDTGPYSFVRHPMYLGVIVLYIATPIALGSYIALVPFLLCMLLLPYRIGNEEEVLERELKGYREYCRKVKYRLVPGVW